MSAKSSNTSRSKLIALITRAEAGTDAPVAAFESTRSAVAQKLNTTPDMLELGTNEMVPSSSRQTLEHAFHSMRSADQDASQTGSSMDIQTAKAVEKAITESCKTQVDAYINTVMTERADALFEVSGERRVKAAVLRLAPSQIIRVVDEMAPQLVDHTVTTRVEEAVKAEMTHIATALESTVHHMVRKELHGAFGDKVTQNIRTLISLELEKLLAAKKT